MKPWKCCQCLMFFGSPLALTAIVRLSPLIVNVASPVAFNPVTVVFSADRWAT